MRRLLAGGVILAVLALLAFGSVAFLFGEDIFGPDPEAVDRDNEELMTSLPAYPGATLVQKYVTTGETRRDLRYDRVLTYAYATSAESEAVLAFYRRNLPESGPQGASGNSTVLASFRAGDFYVDLILFEHGLPDLPPEVKNTAVASPPSGTVTLFGVSVSQ